MSSQIQISIDPPMAALLQGVAEQDGSTLETVANEILSACIDDGVDLKSLKPRYKMLGEAYQSKRTAPIDVDKDSRPTTAGPPPFGEIMLQFKPMAEIESLLKNCLLEMGLEVKAKNHTSDKDREFIGWSCLIPKAKGEYLAWMDLRISMDRDSCQIIYQTMSGMEAESDTELRDAVSETLNILQGTVKHALESEGAEVFAPFLPMSVLAAEIESRISAGRVGTYEFGSDDMTIQVQVIESEPQVADSDAKKLQPDEVLADKVMSSNDVALMNEGTPLTQKYIERLEMVQERRQTKSFKIIRPSDMTKLFVKKAC